MSKSLLKHFVAMQTQAARYIEPTPDYSTYASDSATWAEGETPSHEDRTQAFAHDMIYMLDGPEQRKVQAEASFDFVAESMVTASNTFHGEKVSITELVSALEAFSAAADRLDRVKKALFYGRDYIANPVRPQPSRPDEDNTAYPIIERIAETLTLHDGSKPGFAGQEPHSEDRVVKLVEQAFHGIIGVATESGEMVDAWLSAYKHNKPLDLANLREEFGDNQWYVAVEIDALGKLLGMEEPTFDELHRNVNRKLRHRFPDGFSEFDANNRDLIGERRILEGKADLPADYLAKFTGGGFMGCCGQHGEDGHAPECSTRDNDQGATFDAEEVAASNEMTGGQCFDSQDVISARPDYDPNASRKAVENFPGKQSDET